VISGASPANQPGDWKATIKWQGVEMITLPFRISKAPSASVDTVSGIASAVETPVRGPRAPDTIGETRKDDAAEAARERYRSLNGPDTRTPAQGCVGGRVSGRDAGGCSSGAGARHLSNRTEDRGGDSSAARRELRLKKNAPRKSTGRTKGAGESAVR
jgi:hypothetical protein